MKIRVVVLLILTFLFFLSPIALLAKSQDFVSGIFYDTDLREIIRNIAAQTGITIVMDDTVRGTVSVEFDQVPVEEALTQILSPQGYSFRKIDNYYVISSGEIFYPAFKSISITKIIKPRYLDVSMVKKLLLPELISYVKVDERENLILITAPPPIVKKISDMIASVDGPPAPIMLQVLIVEVTREEGVKMNVDWNWQWVGERENSEGVSAEGLAIGYTSEDIFATIDTLVRKGKAKIKGNPKVITLEGVEAKLQVETQEYFQVLGEVEETPQFRLEAVTAKTEIETIPRLGSKDEVILDIKITSEELNQMLEVPQITRRSAETTVKLRSHKTVAIAGLSEEIQREVKERIWGVGDVPVLDLLFSNRYSEEEETQLVIFITPYLLEKELPPSDVGLSAATWNTWSPLPKYVIESENFTPSMQLNLTGYFDRSGEYKRGYRFKINYTPLYAWNIGGGYSIFQGENYKLSSYSIGFQKELPTIKEGLSLAFNYQRWENRFKADLKKEDFYQNMYSFSLGDTTILTKNFYLMGNVKVIYIEEKGIFSPAITFFSGGPVICFGGLRFSGKYSYALSAHEEYQQKGYTAELLYTFPGESTSIILGYQETERKDVKYMTVMELPIRGYYICTKLLIK